MYGSRDIIHAIRQSGKPATFYRQELTIERQKVIG